MRITTMPEFIRRRFGQRAAEFLSWYGLMIIIVAWVGSEMFVGGRLLAEILGLPEWQCLVGLAVVFTSFTVAGGFAAVMVTDTFQAMLMILSMLILNVIAFSHIGSLDRLIQNIPGDHWMLVRPASDAQYPWPAIFLGYPVLGFWFWCTDQTIVQRMLGARDLRQAQLGAAFTGFLKILPPFLFIMPGMFCLVLEPKLRSADTVFVTMLSHYMPIGMLGLMISVLGAASVASVAGGLNAFSTIFTMDIYQRKVCPTASARHLKRVGQLVVVAVATAAVGAALFLQQCGKTTIFDTLQGVTAYFAPPVATVFLLGILWKRATAAAAVTTLYLGSTVSITLGILDFLKLPYEGFWPHFMLMTLFLFIGCVVMMTVVSLLTHKAEYEEDFTIIKTGEAHQNTRPVVWLLFGLLALIMAVIYFIFD
jgi:SSS family solute:Na+ symporter